MSKELSTKLGAEWLLVMDNGEWIWIPESVALKINQSFEVGSSVQQIQVSPTRTINVFHITSLMGAKESLDFMEQKGKFRCSAGRVHKLEDQCRCNETIGLTEIVGTFPQATINNEQRDKLQEMKNQIRQKWGWPEKDYEAVTN